MCQQEFVVCDYRKHILLLSKRFSNHEYEAVETSCGSRVRLFLEWESVRHTNGRDRAKGKGTLDPFHNVVKHIRPSKGYNANVFTAAFSLNTGPTSNIVVHGSPLDAK